MQACGLKSLVDYFNVKPMIYERKCDYKERDSNCAHPFPRVSGYKRGSNITKGGITKGRVYHILSTQPNLFKHISSWCLFLE